MIRYVTSVFLNKKLAINDDCGCTDGGFYEKEITQHGFHGAKWVVGVFIHCKKCNKELKQVSVINELVNSK